MYTTKVHLAKEKGSRESYCRVKSFHVEIVDEINEGVNCSVCENLYRKRNFRKFIEKRLEDTKGRRMVYSL